MYECVAEFEVVLNGTFYESLNCLKEIISLIWLFVQIQGNTYAYNHNPSVSFLFVAVEYTVEIEIENEIQQTHAQFRMKWNKINCTINQNTTTPEAVNKITQLTTRTFIENVGERRKRNNIQLC